MSESFQRQVHLDFHTSPHIADVGAEFDAEVFAETFAAARVNSVNLFSKCHHGMCYYPTQVGVRHPALGGRDLLGEQMEALKRRGIRCPVYTTVGWEEEVAARFPEWRQMLADGRFARLDKGADFKTVQPAGWWFMNFVHQGYQDYIEAHLREILAYEVDGLWMDILFMAEGACWSEASVAFREARGLMGSDARTQFLFEHAAQAAFMERFTRLIHGIRPGLPVFYNAPNHVSPDARYSLLAKGAWQTHHEIESLPSGFWGYHHFPRLARHVAFSDQASGWVSMTGRFQKMWGDFGGIKPQAALEFECFRAQALGGANSVGDQLPPRGTLDAAAYRLIGAVFAQTEAAEAFYDGARPLADVAVIPSTYPGCVVAEANKSEEGAVMMLEELHYDAAVVHDGQDLSGFRAVILTDGAVVTPALRERLEAFHAGGGVLVVAHRGGCDAEGRWALDFLPLEWLGSEPMTPTYWRAEADFLPAMSDSDRVIYSQGERVRGGAGVEVWVRRVLPYFKRTDWRYSSHFQAPPVREAHEFAAVLAGERCVYFADPIFREYRQVGSETVRVVLGRALELLVGLPRFGRRLPVTVLSVPARRGEDLLLSLLHYVPVRKAMDIDVIDERMSFAGQRLDMPEGVTEVRMWPCGTPLAQEPDGAFVLPAVNGRLLLEVPGFFREG